MFHLFLGKGDLVQEIPASPGTRVKVDLGSADLLIAGGESGKIRIALAYEVLPGEEERIKTLLEGLILKEKEGEVRIGPLPRPLSFLVSHAHIFLPRETELEIQGNSSDIVVQSFSGKVRIVSTSGDLRVEEFQGSLEVRGASGDLVLSRVYGALEGVLTSGDVDGSDLKGSFHIKAGSGDIQLDDVLGDVQVATGSGDVAIDGTLEEDEEWRIRSGSGDVSIRFPRGSEFAWDLVTNSGDIACDFPLSQEVGDERRLEGKVGVAPKASLRVSTGSGDISVRARSEL